MWWEGISDVRIPVRKLRYCFGPGAGLAALHLTLPRSQTSSESRSCRSYVLVCRMRNVFAPVAVAKLISLGFAAGSGHHWPPSCERKGGTAARSPALAVHLMQFEERRP